MPVIKAISFDLWDTIFVDDSDEPKRQAAGVPNKAIARRQLLYDAVHKQNGCERSITDCAYNVVDAAFRHVWHQQHVTWSVNERLELILQGLACSMPDSDRAQLVHQLEHMELDFQPDLAKGIQAALAVLAQSYPLLVISDAIFSPGWALRELLRRHGLEQFFSHMVFSDELGCSKPAPRVFHHAAQLVGCAPEELLHIGDREHNDVRGPQSVGAQAILSTVVVDRESANTKAHAICRNYDELSALVRQLNGGES